MANVKLRLTLGLRLVLAQIVKLCCTMSIGLKCTDEEHAQCLGTKLMQDLDN